MSSSTIVLITGANTGLGLEVIRALARSDSAYTVLVGCRTTSKGEEAVAKIKKDHPSSSSTFQVLQVDLASDISLQKAIETIANTYSKLDVLVNNAGINCDPEIQSGAIGVREGFNLSWEVNVCGTHVITYFATPLLLKSSNPRLLFLTSGTAAMASTEVLSPESMRNINSSPPRGWPKMDSSNPLTAYRSSKAGLNMLMREWNRVLRNDDVKVWALSPGYLATTLGGYTSEQLTKMGAMDPSIGADLVVGVIEGQRDQDVGKVVKPGGIEPW